MRSFVNLGFIFLLAASILMSPQSAEGTSLTISSDAGAFNQEFGADTGDRVVDHIVIADEAMENDVSGSGNHKMSYRFSKDTVGSAEAGVEIRNAESYQYHWYLRDGIYSDWEGSPSYVKAGLDNLNVINAAYIKAYSSAIDERGDTATVNTEIIDRARKASLLGYYNDAEAIVGANYSYARANQYLTSNARALGGEIRHSGRGTIIEGDVVDTCALVRGGSIARYSDRIFAGSFKSPDSSGNFATAERGSSNMAGNNIQIDSKAKSADGHAVSISTKVQDGSIGLYSDKTGAGISNTSYYSQRYADGEHSGSGLLGKRIEIDEKASSAEGHTASASILDSKGSIGWYTNRLNAGKLVTETTSNEEARVSHDINQMAGSSIKVHEDAKNAEGHTASANTLIQEGSINWYYSDIGGRKGDGMWTSSKDSTADGFQWSSGVQGKMIQVDEQVTNADGSAASTSTIVKGGSMGWNSRTIKAGYSSYWTSRENITSISQYFTYVSGAWISLKGLVQNGSGNNIRDSQYNRSPSGNYHSNAKIQAGTPYLDLGPDAQSVFSQA